MRGGKIDQERAADKGESYWENSIFNLDGMEYSNPLLLFSTPPTYSALLLRDYFSTVDSV